MSLKQLRNQKFSSGRFCFSVLNLGRMMGNFILVAYDRQAGSSFNSQSPTRSPIVFVLLLCFSITNPQRRNRAFGSAAPWNASSSAKVDVVGVSGGGSCQPHQPFLVVFLTLARVGGARRACPCATRRWRRAFLGAPSVGPKQISQTVLTKIGTTVRATPLIIIKY